MDANDLRKKSPEELRKQADELRHAVRDLRFKITSRQVAKVRDLRKAKKDLAQVLTIIRSLAQAS